jgi:hypothetical protein
MAYYVKARDGAFSAFLRKPDADKFARMEGGSVMDLPGAVASTSG